MTFSIIALDCECVAGCTTQIGVRERSAIARTARVTVVRETNPRTDRAYASI